METRLFGATGRSVPVFGQGTWHMEQNPAASVAALRRGIDLGMTHIDTAEMYGSGAAEEVVAQAIAGRREEVFLVSKVLPGNASRKDAVAACEKSLARLRTDHLDCYLLHWRGRHPLAETAAAMQQLQSAGKILSWGVSNFDVPDLEELHQIAGPGKVACNQVLYHLEERAIEHAVIPWCADRQVAVVGYSPFGSGSFPDAKSEGGRVLQQVAGNHGATPRQAALAFLIRNPALFLIPKAGSTTHAEENAANVKLTESDLDTLETAFPRGPRPRHLPMI